MRMPTRLQAPLDFAALEAGRARVVFEPLELGRLTTDAAESFRSAFEAAELDYAVTCPPLPKPVYVDADMWEKIVLNLISNALKFTRDGQVAVSLRADDAHAMLQVRDSGPGIPPEQQEQIFERFHRVKGAEGRTHEGSGIGLALVRELAQLHGGSVDVVSMPGIGSTFTVRIPFGSAHLPWDRIEEARSGTRTGLWSEAFVEETMRRIRRDEGTEGS